ncbi:MAG: hypothetical protein JW751_07940 [Polyangiaceae bacterium]|nr:hypothetical protein [Polyangiaceae bacterium]
MSPSPNPAGGVRGALGGWVLLAGALVILAGLYALVIGRALRRDPTDSFSTASLADQNSAVVAPWTVPAPPRPFAHDPAPGRFGPLAPALRGLGPQVDSTRPRPALWTIAFHLVNVSLLFALLGSGRKSPLAALGISLGWGLLPRLVESVMGAGGGRVVFATTGVLVGLLLVRAHNWVGRYLGALTFLSATLVDEVALAGLFSAAWITVRDRPVSVREVTRSTAPLLGVLVAYLGLRLAAGRFGPALGSPLSPLARAGVLLEAFGTYAWLLVDPIQPWARIGLVAEPSYRFRCLGAFLLAALVIGAWRRRRTGHLRDERAALGWSLLLAALAMSMDLAPLMHEVVAVDHRIYLPAAGAAALAVPALERVAARWRWSPVAWVAPLLLLTVVSVVRLETWLDERRFWIVTHRTTRPSDPLPAIALGRILLRAGLADRARPLLDAALSAEAPPRTRRPSLLELAALGRVSQGDYDGAVPLLDELVALRADDPDARLARGRLDLARVDLAAAWGQLAELEARFPDHAAVRAWANEVAQAVDLADRVRHPIVVGDPVRARAFARLGRYPDAVAEWRRVLEQRTLPDPIASEAMESLIRFAAPEVAVEVRLDFLRHRINEPDRVLDALLVARRGEVSRLRELLDR